MTGLQPGAATMTVLFTDLVDSTAMRSRIGDDQADEVRREHDELITRIVDENRGSIVKGLGDGFMAVFAAPSSGIAGAVGVQQAVARRNRQARIPIALKMGLSVGEVRVESDDVYGTPVVEASRLCSAAGADQILAAEHVKLLAGSRSSATYRPFGELELKGLSEPLHTLEVLWWEASDAPSVPFPELASLAPGSAFVGRSIERYAIGHAWLNARTAKAPVVFVTGPAGIGKTRLVAEFARKTTRNEGGIVLFGRCTEGGGPAFQPFAEAIRYYVSNVPAGQLADLLGSLAGELARIVPELAEQIPSAKRASEDPDFDRLRLFDAVAGWLAAASRDEPMVLILDDLQWASQSTLDLFRHVAEAPTPMRALIVGIADTSADASGAGAEQLAELEEYLRASDRGLEPIGLRGFSAEDVAALLSDVIGDLGAANDSLAERVRERTDGNPLFVGAIGRGLVRAGVVVHASDADTWSVKGDVAQLKLPPTVASAVTVLIGLLGDAAVKMLQAASVIGDEFDLAVLRALSDLDDDAFTAALDAATAAGVLIELPGSRQRYAFDHVVAQHALAATVDAPRQKAWHQQIVAEIERHAGSDLDRYLVDLARHHLASAQAGDDVDGAVQACMRVGDRARDQLAPDEAVIWYRRALDLLERGDEQNRLLPLLLVLGETERRAGLDSARETLLRAASLAMEASDPERLVEAVLGNVRVYIGRPGALDAERVATLRNAAEVTVDAPPAMRARVLSLLASELVWDPEADTRFGLADEALALARGTRDQRVLANVLLLRVPTIASPDTLDERVDISEELYELAGQLEDPLLRFHAALHRCNAAGEAGDIEAFDRWLGIAGVVASGLDIALLTWLVSLARSSRAYLAGDLVAAERHADEALAAGRDAGRAEAQLFHGATMLAVRRLQGRMDEIAGSIDASSSSSRTDMFVLARAVADAGRVAEAEAPYRAIAAAGFPIGREPYAATTLINLAYLAALLGDVDGSAKLYELLEPMAERFANAIVFEHVGAHYLAMLAATLDRPDEAHTWFERAVALHEKAQAPLMVAETQLEWARVCYGTGNIERARELIGQALGASAKGNADGLSSQARELLNVAFGGGDERAPDAALDAAVVEVAVVEAEPVEPEAVVPTENESTEPVPEPADLTDFSHVPVPEPVPEPAAAPEDAAPTAAPPVAPPPPVLPPDPAIAAPPPPPTFVVPPLPPVPPRPAPIPVYVPAAAAPPPPPPMPGAVPPPPGPPPGPPPPPMPGPPPSADPHSAGPALPPADMAGSFGPPPTPQP